ncbi:MAG TPA: ABC transporter substrate-binding protein [Clostridiales bacterium]|nr:MAG: Oligopeptide-binding protein AppA precursor [Firmicutes bacterium ADurb.Bin262]HOU09773.1 ABC transporter substrate-binding protein [Clostridiales bacterium]HQK72900.1 ABC transporter substrate-binding protein [Clostridiales bacterium]
MKQLYARCAAFFLSILFAAAFFTACGRESGPDTSTTAGGGQQTTAAPDITSSDTLRLPYSQDDSLNPFLAASAVNIRLAPLVYDSLVKNGADFRPVPLLAESVRQAGLNLTVMLKQGTVFSDGAPLRAQDAADSFRLAKTSPGYARRLDNIASVKATSENTLVFTLAKPDPNAAACLDYPVAASPGTGKRPVGSGRYLFPGAQGTTLVLNQKHPDFAPGIKKIVLVDIKTDAALATNLRIGNIDFTFDNLESGSFNRISDNTSEIALNNLVYLAFNSRSALLADSEIRRALTLALDSAEIASMAFDSHAAAASAPFHPLWTAALGFDFTRVADAGQAAELLEALGFTAKGSGGTRYSSRGDLEFSLLVNAESAFKTEAAALAAKQLKKAGVTLNVKRLKRGAFLNAVRSGGWDMYIGEVRLPASMNLSAFFGGAAGYGIDADGGAGAAYRLYLGGKLNLEEFVETFGMDAPFAPICFTNAVASFSAPLKVHGGGTTSDPFAGIEDWNFVG